MWSWSYAWLCPRVWFVLIRPERVFSMFLESLSARIDFAHLGEKQTHIQCNGTSSALIFCEKWRPKTQAADEVDSKQEIEKEGVIGAWVHYVMVSKFQWKPFWLATQRDPQNDWTATQNRVNYDVFAQVPLSLSKFVSRYQILPTGVGISGVPSVTVAMGVMCALLCLSGSG